MEYFVDVDGTINSLDYFDVGTVNEIKSELEKIRKEQKALYEKSEKHTLSQEVVIVNNDLSIIKKGIKESGMSIKKIVAYNSLLNNLIEKIKENQLDPTKNRIIFSDIEKCQKLLIENIKTRYYKKYKMKEISSGNCSKYSLYKYEIQESKKKEKEDKSKNENKDKDKSK